MYLAMFRCTKISPGLIRMMNICLLFKRGMYGLPLSRNDALRNSTIDTTNPKNLGMLTFRRIREEIGVCGYNLLPPVFISKKKRYRIRSNCGSFIKIAFHD